jgi:deoxyribodipyrimidine photo-lyase
MKYPVNIFWFRRDLRLDDNAGLYHALKSEYPVVPIFIFDKNILDELEDPKDRRVEFIYDSLEQMQKQLESIGSTLDVRYGFPNEIWKQLINDYKVKNVFTNNDYEPYAKKRDEEIIEMLRSDGISVHSSKDQVIFEKSDVVKDDSKPYTVFTPYSRKWKATINDLHLKRWALSQLAKNSPPTNSKKILLKITTNNEIILQLKALQD